MEYVHAPGLAFELNDVEGFNGWLCVVLFVPISVGSVARYC